MTKSKLFGIASLIAVGAFAIGSFAFAESATLAVSCSGTLSGTNQIVWSAVATGGNAPYSFVWSGNSSIASSTASTTTGTYVTSTVSTAYTADIIVTDASSTVATSSCSQTIVGITPTSTPPAPRVNPPSLSVGQNGAFLGRGMTVTSIGTDSFQASVWGITYTVNWSGNLAQPFEFYFRYLKAGATSTPATQLQVGDEVGVAGTVSSASPLVVTASVVRDYSIATPRAPIFHGEGNGKGNNGNGLGNGGPNGSNGNGNGNVTTSNNNLSNRLSQLLQQFQDLQNLFKGHGNGK